eukprot:1157472-Pelagomonas_calceolata.AAC.1
MLSVWRCSSTWLASSTWLIHSLLGLCPALARPCTAVDSWRGPSLPGSRLVVWRVLLRVPGAALRSRRCCACGAVWGGDKTPLGKWAEAGWEERGMGSLLSVVGDVAAGAPLRACHGDDDEARKPGFARTPDPSLLPLLLLLLLLSVTPAAGGDTSRRSNTSSSSRCNN